jgi:PilZ domain
VSQQKESDKRRKPRVHYETDIRIKLDKFEIRTLGSSMDLSLNGIFVKTDEDIPVETECMVEISLSGTTENLQLTMQGTVVRKGSSGIGISFNSMDIDSYTHLKNVVRYNSENPDIIY